MMEPEHRPVQNRCRRAHRLTESLFLTMQVICDADKGLYLISNFKSFP